MNFQAGIDTYIEAKRSEGASFLKVAQTLRSLERQVGDIPMEWIRVLVLTACNTDQRPSASAFQEAINRYFAKHGQTCISIGHEFPVDVPRSMQGDSSETSAKLIALQQAGLVSESDTIAVVHGMLDALRGPAPPQLVRRYQLTAEGRKYFQQVPGSVGPVGGFCYGQKRVDSITNWTQPEAGSSQAEVTYTYKVVNLASWAERTDVQQAFFDIRSTIDGASKANQTAGVQLTNRGWEVPGS